MKTISFALKIISFLLLIFIWIFTIINFKNLPETIPIHYNLDGTPDGFGSKGTIWFETGLVTVIYLIMLYSSKAPGFPFLNVPQNIKNNPLVADFVLSILMLLVTILFADINYESILNALGKTKGISSFINYWLGVVFLLIVGMMVYSYRISKNKQ